MLNGTCGHPGGRILVVCASILATFCVAPAIATVPDVTTEGWYAGDGHVHSEFSYFDWAYIRGPFSDCDRPTVEQQLTSVAEAGLSWAVMTEHEDMLLVNSYLDLIPFNDHAYSWDHQADGVVKDALLAVQQAMQDELLEVGGVGEELGTSLLPGVLDLLIEWDEHQCLGHFLGYGMDEFITWAEEEYIWQQSYPSAVDMLEATYEGGVGTVAHPMHPGEPNPWQAWYDLEQYAEDHQVGFEVLNGDRFLDGSLEIWQSYIRSGKNIHLAGNSDGHCPGDMARAVTFVRLEPWEDLTEDGVLEALQEGRTVASQGPFAGLWLINEETGDEAHVGDTLAASIGDSMRLHVSWRTHDGDDPGDNSSFGDIERIRVYDRGHTYSASPTQDNPLATLRSQHGVSGTVGTVSNTYLPTGSGFVWMLAETTTGKVAITSPVFIDVPGSVLTGTRVDTALIIDSSGSMSSTDPDDHRLSAGKFYVDLAQTGDYITVVDFDSNAEVLAELMEASSNRDTLKDAVDAIDSSGSTNLGVGLSSGFDELDSSVNDNAKIAIMLTDGDGDYDNEADDYAAQGWRVYTVGLSDDADAVVLQEIADVTGGTFTQVSTEDATQAALEEIYRAIATDVAGLLELLADVLDMIEGQVESWFVDVSATMDLLRVSITWGGSEFDLRLIQPDGTVLDASTADPNVSYGEGNTYAVMTVAYPQQGQWTVEVTAVDVAVGGEPVSIYAAANTSTLPEVAFLAPEAGSQIDGTVTVQIRAADFEGVESVELLADGAYLSDTTSETLNYEWDSTTVEDGQHTLWAVVVDQEGNSSNATLVLNVLNNPDDTLPALDVGDDVEGFVGEEIPLQATPLNEAAEGAAYLWDMGDGGLAGGLETSYIYNEAGTYTVICYVYTESNLTGYDSLDVIVAEQQTGDDDDDSAAEVGDDDDDDDDGSGEAGGCECSQRGDRAPATSWAALAAFAALLGLRLVRRRG